jgi:O-antigen/teichoic acid export membrane protein
MFRDVAQSIARNTSILFVQQIITWTSRLVMLLLLPRYLGPGLFGVIFLAGSITEMFRIFADFGARNLVVKEVSRAREQTAQILVDTVAPRLAFGAAALGGVVLLTVLSDYSFDVAIVVFITALTLLWSSVLATLIACYQGHEVMQYSSAAVVVESVTLTVAFIIAMFLDAGVTVFAILGISCNFLSLLVLVHFRKKVLDYLPRVNWPDALRRIREGVPYFLHAAFSTIYYRVDVFMLSIMTPEKVVGWYGASYRLFDYLGFLPHIYTTAAYPILSKLWTSETDTHRRTTHKSIELMVISGIPLAIGMAAMAPGIIGLLFGIPEYEGSITLYRILLLSLPILYVDFMLATTLLASDKQKQMSLVSMGAIPVNVGLNMLLIPFFQEREGNGATGAALATVLTEIGIMGMFLALLPKGILKGFRAAVILKSVAGGVVMALCFLGGEGLGIPWLLQGIVAFGVYPGVLLALRTFEPAEVEYAKHVLVPKVIGRITGKKDHTPSSEQRREEDA